MKDKNAVRAIRALRFIRDKKQVAGNDLLDFLRSEPEVGFAIEKNNKTGLLGNNEKWDWEAPIEIMALLLNANLISVKHKDGSSSSEEFINKVSKGGPYAIGRYTFSVSSNLELIQDLLGITSFGMLENWAIGQIVNVNPIWGFPDRTTLISKRVFVIMPFAKELRPVYDRVIKPLANHFKVECSRIDEEIFSNKVIMNQIWSSIYTCDLIIADCTGRNPNVFYELGIAHTVGKDTITLAQSIEDIPFDIRHYKHYIYESSKEGLENLGKELYKAFTAFFPKPQKN